MILKTGLTVGRRWRVALVAAFVLLSSLTGTSRPKDDGYGAAATLLVGLQPGVSEDEIHGVLRSFGARATNRIEELHLLVVETRAGAAEAIIRRLERHPAVRYAERDLLYTTAAAPNDPQYRDGRQWNIDRVQAPAAWDLLPAGERTLVAVLDTGVDYGQPDFSGQISPLGCDQFLRSCMREGGAAPPRDIEGHGTHVAGILGAATNNGVGVASVSGGRVTVLPIKVSIRGSGGIYSAAVFDAIVYAVRKGAKVINMSFGGACGNEASRVWRDALDFAEQHGVLFVKAAGNGGGCDQGRYPDSDPRVLAVAAVDRSNGMPSFSARGFWVSVAAPGVDILSTVPGGYALESGTSAAAPHVAALAAMLFQVPGATKAQVMDWITSTCDPVGLNVQCGGVINAYRAVHLAVKGSDPGRMPTQTSETVGAPLAPGETGPEPTTTGR